MTANGKQADETTVLPTERDGDKVEKQEKKEEGDERGEWTGRLDFLMSALSFAVGMGNVWRFPYLVYSNGGGAFLIPYIIMVIFAGIPLIFLELSIGQYASLGVVSIWRACPIFKGIGWTMFLISFISCMYYNMLIAYSFFYVFASFASDVPWRNCDNPWNTDACGSMMPSAASLNCTQYNGTFYNETCYFRDVVGDDVYNDVLNITNMTASIKPKSPSDEYFHNNMLDISDGFHYLGAPKWQLALCLLLCWILVILGLSTGVKSLGKATYVTSIFPYIILSILFVRGITLEGSTDGILYYLTPQWHRLASAKVWADAAVQVFFSMSNCWGGLITLASYNKFNNNCLRDSIFIAMGDTLTAIFGGVVIFTIIGYMAHMLNAPIEEVATQGAGLAYIVYPQVVTQLPLAPLWAILFMLMLINLGIGTQFTLVTTVHTTLLDVFPQYLRKNKRPLVLLLVICAVCYTVGLIFTTRGGMYVLQLFDTYAPSYGLLVVGVAESIALAWVYGEQRLSKDIKQMLGVQPSKFWFICWKFITPALIMFILLFNFADFKRSAYGDYTFPVWVDVFGWFISAIEIACIPVAAIYAIANYDKADSLWQRIKGVTKPEPEWGPALENRGKDAQQEWQIPLAKKTKEAEAEAQIDADARV